MIEIQLKDIVNNIDLMQSIAQKTLSARSAFVVARMLREMDKEYQSFVNIRNDIVMQYAMKDDNGEVIRDDKGNVQIEKEQLQEFNQKINELLDTKLQLNVTQMTLNDLDGVSFTPREMMMLEPFIME